MILQWNTYYTEAQPEKFDARAAGIKIFLIKISLSLMKPMLHTSSVLV